MKLPLHPACRLLTADPSGLVAVDKSIGVLSHPNPSRDTATAVLDAPYDFELEAYRGGDDTWYLLNRLDAPTSGVILLANSPVVAEAVKAAFANQEVEKCYAALIKGIPPRKQDHWSDHLNVMRRGGQLRTEVRRGHPNAVTRVELLDRGKGPPARSLVALFPGTGRTHQLRVQCASRHLPIIGDATYGNFSFNREFKRRNGENRLFLHSWKTRLTITFNGKPLSFAAESPLPTAFTVALGQSPTLFDR